MLDSRYVHLHEALGLGVMWLKQGAKVIHLPDAVNATASPTPSAVAPTTPSKSHHTGINSARQAILQRLNAPTTPQTRPLSPITPEPQTEIASPVPMVDVPKVRVMALSVCASVADIAMGKLFSGEDGVLLHKMFHAINLQPEQVYLTTWLKDLPDFNPKPPTEIVQSATARLQTEWQRSQADALLLMGDFFDREDVRTEVNKIRGNKPYFTIPHPQRILSNPKLKRGAWETLQGLEGYLKQVGGDYTD